MILRPAHLDDAPAIAALEATLFGPNAWSAAAVRAEILGKGPGAVAVDADQVIGYAMTRSAGGATDLVRIGVAADRQRRGVARTLLESVATDRMLLEVGADNAGALAFYGAAGFREIDRRRRYYPDGADAVVMERGTPG